MSVFMIVVWIVVLCAALSGIYWGGSLWIRRREQAELLGEVNRQLAGVPILALAPDASFKGLDRAWDSRWRGSGVLILTGEMLYFRSLQRKLDLAIPLTRIEKVTLDAAVGKNGAAGTPFLVSYRGMDDQVRRATWHVKKPGEWVHMLDSILLRGHAREEP